MKIQTYEVHTAKPETLGLCNLVPGQQLSSRHGYSRVQYQMLLMVWLQLIVRTGLYAYAARTCRIIIEMWDTQCMGKIQRNSPERIEISWVRNVILRQFLHQKASEIHVLHVAFWRWFDLMNQGSRPFVDASGRTLPLEFVLSRDFTHQVSVRFLDNIDRTASSCTLDCRLFGCNWRHGCY